MSPDADHADRVNEATPRPPSGYLLLVSPDRATWTVGLRSVFLVVASGWKWITISALAVGIIVAAILSQLPNVYRSQVVIAPINPNEGGLGSALGGELSGLAALAGVQIGTGASKREERIATLKSQGLARDFILKNGLLPQLFSDEWDSATKAWRDKDDAPTLEDSVRLFTSDVRQISEDKRTGILTLSVEWTNPETAARWANSFVEMANEHLRRQAIENAELSIDFLNRELKKQELVQIREGISRLIETQVNNAMIANVQREFAFRILDEAVPSDLKRKVAPRRTLITLGVSFLTGMLVAFGVLWRRRNEWLVVTPEGHSRIG